MEITDIDVVPISMERPSSYEMASGTIESNDSIIVRLHTDEDLTGLGETSIGLPELDTTFETLAFTLDRKVKPLLIGEEATNLERLLGLIDDLSWNTGEFTFAKAAIDIAVYDLLGKRADLPVYALLGGRVRDTNGVSRSIGRGDSDEVADKAIKLKEQGYKLLTVKTGFSPGEDLERVAAVRDAVGPDMPIEVDPNQGYSVPEAIDVLGEMEREYDVVNAEQPTVWWDFEGLARVNRNVDMTITADESIRRPHDVGRLARKEAADQVTLKIFEQGGLYTAQRIVETAASHNIACNSGSLHPFGVGTAAIRHLCVAKQNITHEIGYGTPYERFPDDIIDERLEMRDGEVEPPEGPGLGVTLDEEKISEYRTSIEFAV